MGITILFFFRSLCCCFFFYAQVFVSIDAKCHPDDLKALKSFVNGLHTPVQGWDYGSSSDCCSWKGVTCSDPPALKLNDSNVFSRVVGLELPGERLRGNVSESLGDLVQLKTLNLSVNLLTNSFSPNLFSLQNLEVVDLSSNDFYGYAPFNITSPSITFLDISKNNFIGEVDPGFCHIAKQIQALKLSSNRLHGKVLPGFGNCSFLEELSLASNFLSGDLPQDLFAMSKLKVLDLSDNGFSGELSFQIGNLSNLVYLDISFNQFSRLLPDVFFNLRTLEQFAASSNNFTGVLPVSLGNSPSITTLSLDNNSFSGSIDVINCSAMVRLVSLNLGSNHFIGQIGSLSSCSLLQIVKLGKNRLDGDFPESFKNFRSLSHFSISQNGIHNLSAALTALQHCKNLTVLILTFNFHGEIMPTNLNLRFENTRLFAITNCRLTGSMPPWLSSSTKLQFLDLSGNSLSGEIPSSIADLQYLSYLDLSRNSFSGSIPRSFTQFHSLVNLSNPLKGEIFDGCLFYLNSSSNSFSGRQYEQLLVSLQFNLSYNELSGIIWPEFGNLKHIHVLDLSNNKLTGQIPSTLSKLTCLESLDLSYNNLTGMIPPSLRRLSFLTSFDVSYNHLGGRIPCGGQFLALSNTGFVGNDGLCGCQIVACKEESTGEENWIGEGEDEDESLKTGIRVPLYVGAAIGFVWTVVVCFSCGIVFPSEKKWGHKKYVHVYRYKIFVDF
ncbi:phytosulfokine receptor 1-like [Cucumis melo var. makuwa]|uniref:Phytosulfokine receptor 1-like n=1 Tax=Cucumis melo var. makuwa TaxID=1194695 RepID=A0A5D3BEZ5_CUCMM|nr:phytosulfokine receptor 1-like [Cucumis melo var. makuwa]TYJ97191.1 phytosulfokine receptor 1-like [Cucumis melo var. makuwa]